MLTADRHGVSWLVREPFVEAEFAAGRAERWVARTLHLQLASY